MNDKKNKKKGIFRKAFIFPFFAFIFLISIFNFFFLDLILKKSLEYTVEQFYSAEVNVNSLRTNFLELTMEIKEIEFTDKENPTFNKFEVGNIKFSCLWDALLRAKIVIDVADLGDIRVNTKRSRKGLVFPPEASNQIAKETLENAKEEFKGNIFADISSLLGGSNLKDVSKAITLDLESEKKFQELETELETKEKEIQQRIDRLPTKKEQKNFEKRLSAIKWKDLGNLLKAPGVLSEVNDLKKDVEKAKKSLEKASKSLTSSISLVEKSYQEANNSIKSDISKLNKRAKLPSLDTESIARVLFGKDLIREINKYRSYFDTAKKYIPEKKNKVAAPVKTKRGEGRTYHFGTPKSYPLFWLKKLRISSENEQGVVSGEILDITTDQVKLNRATQIKFDADFPEKKVRGVKFSSLVDFREEATMTSELFVKSYPVVNKKLSDSKDVTFTLKKASNQITLNSIMTKEELSFKMKNLIQNIDYETAAKSPQLGSVLEAVAKKTPALTLDAKASGKWSKLKFDIKSNLAGAIEKAVRSLIREKIQIEKNKIKKQVEDRISSSKKKVETKIASFKNKFQLELDKGKAEFDKIKKKVDKEKKSASKKIKKSGGNFLKNIKF